MKRLIGRSRPLSRLAGIPKQSTPLIRLPKFISKSAVDFEGIVLGVFLGGSAFVAVNPSCLGGAPAVARPELALAAGLGLPALFWLFTGLNWVAIAGAGTALAAYGSCKYLASQEPPGLPLERPAGR